jgi:hypothetical protein
LENSSDPGFLRTNPVLLEPVLMQSACLKCSPVF